jgi:hypothetical protein
VENSWGTCRSNCGGSNEVAEMAGNIGKERGLVGWLVDRFVD